MPRYRVHLAWLQEADEWFDVDEAEDEEAAEELALEQLGWDAEDPYIVSIEKVGKGE